MHQDLFLEAISFLPQEKRQLVMQLLSAHPELLEKVIKNFEAKTRALKTGDAVLLAQIHEQEQKMIEDMLLSQ